MFYIKIIKIIRELITDFFGNVCQKLAVIKEIKREKVLFLREKFTVDQRLYPIHDGPFWGCSRMGGEERPHLLKTCHTYLTMMKLGKAIPYLKKM